MTITLYPQKLRGSIEAIPSKSEAHRALICAAFSDKPTWLVCPRAGDDLMATIECLNQLGAEISNTPDGFYVIPAKNVPTTALLNCRESGSTLRFLLPVVGALGINAHFQSSGRLQQRPMSPLIDEMQRIGCRITVLDNGELVCSGQLHPGAYHIDGSISSQFITGLYLALSLLDKPSTLCVFDHSVSAPYIEITKQILSVFGQNISGDRIPGIEHFHSPGSVKIDGDWSNAAFFLAANSLGSDVRINGLSKNSVQGDRIISTLLDRTDWSEPIFAEDFPDLVPILAIVAATKKGAKFTGIQRLRLKESDRLHAIVSMIRSLGGQADLSENALAIAGTGLTGGTVDSFRDHRIAMSAAIASTVCSGNVIIQEAECVQKSYPEFWTDFLQLGGKYELNLR